MLILLQGMHPRSPPTTHLRRGPAAVRGQHPAKAQDPRRDLNIDEGDTWAQEERPVDVRGVDQFGDLVSEFFAVGHLFLRILFLQDAIETGDDVAVDLVNGLSAYSRRRVRRRSGGGWLTDMISP